MKEDAMNTKLSCKDGQNI